MKSNPSVNIFSSSLAQGLHFGHRGTEFPWKNQIDNWRALRTDEPQMLAAGRTFVVK
jgi:hypothetical protein